MRVRHLHRVSRIEHAARRKSRGTKMGDKRGSGLAKLLPSRRGLSAQLVSEACDSPASPDPMITTSFSSGNVSSRP